MILSRWELLAQGAALLAAVVQTARIQEGAVDFGKYNTLMQKIAASPLEKTKEDNDAIQKLAVGVFHGSDEADAPYTILKTKFDPSPLGANQPNPDYKPQIRDLRKDILKKELKLQKSEMKGALAMEVARSL